MDKYNLIYMELPPDVKWCQYKNETLVCMFQCHFGYIPAHRCKYVWEIIKQFGRGILSKGRCLTYSQTVYQPDRGWYMAIVIGIHHRDASLTKIKAVMATVAINNPAISSVTCTSEKIELDSPIPYTDNWLYAVKMKRVLR